jgi:hypothetical protein
MFPWFGTSWNHIRPCAAPLSVRQKRKSSSLSRGRSRLDGVVPKKFINQRIEVGFHIGMTFQTSWYLYNPTKRSNDQHHGGEQHTESPIRVIPQNRCIPSRSRLPMSQTPHVPTTCEQGERHGWGGISQAQRSSCVLTSATRWSGTRVKNHEMRYQQGNWQWDHELNNGTCTHSSVRHHRRPGRPPLGWRPFWTCTYQDDIEDNGDEVKRRANTWADVVVPDVSPWASVHEDFSARPGAPGLACKIAPVPLKTRTW